MATPMRGACLCGAIQFELDPPSRFLAHCHCTMCRRAHGAAMVTWLGVLKPQFRLTRGESDLARYGSSAEATRSFCRVCGTSLFFESTRWAGEVHIAAACLTDAPDRAISAHVYYSDRLPWFDPECTLPKLGGKSGMEKLADDPPTS
jgi:hypothetical protein